MAISGGAKPCVSFQVQGNQLVRLGSHAMAQGVESDMGEAVRRLLAGELVRVQQRGTLPARVAERVEELLRETEG